LLASLLFKGITNIGWAMDMLVVLYMPTRLADRRDRYRTPVKKSLLVADAVIFPGIYFLLPYSKGITIIGWAIDNTYAGATLCPLG